VLTEDLLLVVRSEHAKMAAVVQQQQMELHQVQAQYAAYSAMQVRAVLLLTTFSICSSMHTDRRCVPSPRVVEQIDLTEYGANLIFVLTPCRATLRLHLLVLLPRLHLANSPHLHQMANNRRHHHHQRRAILLNQPKPILLIGESPFDISRRTLLTNYI